MSNRRKKPTLAETRRAWQHLPEARPTVVRFDRVCTKDDRDSRKFGMVMAIETQVDGAVHVLVLLDEDRDERLLTTFLPWCLEKAPIVDDIGRL